MDPLFQSLKSFLAEPFKTPFSFWQYAAIVGITILLVILWIFVLRHIEEGIDAVV